MGKNIQKACGISFRTMRSNNLKRHMLKHEKGRKEEMNMNKTRVGKHLEKIVQFLSKQ